jgi:hypothetical protein
VRSPGSAGSPGRQEEFDIFGSVLHSLIGFEKDVHVHVNVKVDENRGRWKNVAIRPLEGPATDYPTEGRAYG